jgi:hypothetical protein
MKKTLTLLAVMLVIQAQSQVTYKVVKVTVEKYNRYTSDYTPVSKTYPDDMTILLFGNLITVTNKAKSNYRTTGRGIERTTDKYRETEWSCTDEENIRCKLSLIYYFSGATVIFVSYSDMIVIYEIE